MMESERAENCYTIDALNRLRLRNYIEICTERKFINKQTKT
jgi:hypothetical protein